MALEPDKYFRLENGKVLRSLSELSQALDSMPRPIFDHHVTKDRNDFSNWIKDVFKGERLAKDISKTKTPQSMKSKIDLFLKPKKIVKKPIVKKKASVKKTVKRPTDPKPTKKIKRKAVKKEPAVAEIYYEESKDGPKDEKEHSILYTAFFKDKWQLDDENKKVMPFYKNWIRYGFIEFLLGFAMGALFIMAIKGWI